MLRASHHIIIPRKKVQDCVVTPRRCSKMTLLHILLTITLFALSPSPSLGFAPPPQRATRQSTSNSQLYQRKETKSFKLFPPAIFRPTPLNNLVKNYRIVVNDDETTYPKKYNDNHNNPVIMKEMHNVAAMDSLQEKAATTTSAAQPMKMSDAVSIIAGTAVGGGFLVLPSVTNPIGYFPSVLGLVLVWSYLLLSSTAFVEAAGLVVESQQQQQKAGNVQQQVGGTSVANVIRHAFGKKWADLGGLAFAAHMFAVVTANVVKGAQLTANLAGVPYVVGCMVPTFGVGLFAFGSKPEIVERANTILTSLMIGGFVALMCSTVATGNFGGQAAAQLFQRAHWTRLLPTLQESWAMPHFINLLCFGHAMPLVVERMFQSVHHSSSSGDENDNSSDAAVATTTTESSPLIRARSAALVGSGVPFVLALVWATISTALATPSSSDPIAFLLASSPAIAIPVLLLAIGAIGTTLLGSFLAMGHFAVDMMMSSTKLTGDDNSSSAQQMWKRRTVEFGTVLIPCALACAGPGLYLPLLAFAGAYPTTILYGLVPSLAALVLRKRVAQHSNNSESHVPRLVPGGQPTLMALTMTSVGLLSASTILAIRHAVRAARLAFV